MRTAKKKRVVNSRLKAYQEFLDNFSGAALKSGWKSYRGSWILATGSAVSSSDPTSYAISGVKLSVPNFTASAGVSGGTGLTYWVSDANSWVASVSYNTSVTTTPCNSGLATGASNPPAGNCCGPVTTIPGAAAYSYAASFQNAYSYSYSATLNSGYSYSYPGTLNSGYSYSYSASYQQPSSYTYTASNSFTAQRYCCGIWNITKTAPERINGENLCYRCPGQCADYYSSSRCCDPGLVLSGSSCYYPASSTYSCPSGGSLSGTTCTVSTGGGYSCPGGGSLSGSSCIVSVGPYYTCPSGGNLSGSTCNVSVSSYFSCPSGGSLSGSTCTVNVSGYYYCPSGGNLSGSTCNVAAGANQYTCFTATTTQTSYNYYLRVIKSIGGAVSTVGSDVALPSQPLAIKVVTFGTSVESTAYSSVSMSTSIGSRSDTISSPSPTGVVGIIKSPSQYGQGSTVSNFSATI